MKKVFVMYQLKPGVDIEKYSEWSRTMDQRITPTQDGCIRFEVYAIEGAEEGQPRYQVIEDIEVESWEAWQKTVGGDGMKPIVESFPNFVDVDTVHAIYGRRIV